MMRGACVACKRLAKRWFCGQRGWGQALLKAGLDGVERLQTMSTMMRTRTGGFRRTARVLLVLLRVVLFIDLVPYRVLRIVLITRIITVAPITRL